ncbi:G-protein coupled receptor 161-like [Mytilus trossulus]|uniref:G-protein coupled receptor 161-like n=1 Tax=Mytilus trossulus TaxID=6551 RepID=UPI003005E3FD
MILRHLMTDTETNCNNSDPNSSQCGEDMHSVGLSLKALSLGIIFIVSMVMNGTVCLVFYKKTQLLSVSNTFVLNLICCQLAICVIVLPFSLASIFSSKWIFNDIWCHIEGFILTFCIAETQFSLTIIAVDRNYAIINSLRYPYVFTIKRGHIAIAVSWATSVAISIPPLAGFSAYSYSPDENTCTLDWNCSLEFSVMFLSICFLFPLLIQSWCYLTIFHAAMNHTKRNHRVFPSLSTTVGTRDAPSDSSEGVELSTQVVQVSYKSMECKAMRTILFIACSYAICWVPYMVCAVYRLVGISITYDLGSFTIVMIFFNTAVDPLIYAFMNRIMRFEIYKFYCDSLSKVAGKTSSYDESDDGVSSTNMSQTHSTSRMSRTSSIKSRSTKGSAPGRVEMNPIKEEIEPLSESQKAKSTVGLTRKELVLTPVDIHRESSVSSMPSSSKRKKATIEIHPKDKDSIQSSQIHSSKPKRSRSEVWTKSDKTLVSEQESFLFFKLGDDKKTNHQYNRLRCSISNSSTNQTRIKTVCGKTTLTSSTFIQNESDLDLQDLDIVAELSIDVRRKRKAMKDKNVSGSREGRNCLSA